MKLVKLQKNNKSNKCICVNYGKKDWSKLINKQYNKYEYRHWYNLLIALSSKIYKIFKDTFYWPVHKIQYTFYPSPFKHSAFCFIFSFPFLFPHTNVYITRRSKIKSKHFFPWHTPSLWFFVKNNSAKVILIFSIEYLKLVLVFLKYNYIYGVLFWYMFSINWVKQT